MATYLSNKMQIEYDTKQRSLVDTGEISNSNHS